MKEKITETLTFVSKNSITKTMFNGKIYKAGGCGYNKETDLINQIFGKDVKYNKFGINTIETYGVLIETKLIEIIKEVA